MTSTELEQDIMAAIERHWTIHALRRFRERYNLDDYDPASLIDEGTSGARTGLPQSP